jgi:hypothetical protein
MFTFGYRGKLIAGATILVVMIMIASMISVSVVINRQNRAAGKDLIRRSFDIISDDVKRKQNKLLNDTAQVATVGKIGDKLKYLGIIGKMKSSDMAQEVFREIAAHLYDSLSLMPDVQSVSVSDSAGEILVHGAVHDEKMSFVIPGAGGDKGAYAVAAVHRGESLGKESWKNQKTIPPVFQSSSGTPPEKATGYFQRLGSDVALTAAVPALSGVFNKKTGKMEKKQSVR